MLSLKATSILMDLLNNFQSNEFILAKSKQHLRCRKRWTMFMLNKRMGGGKSGIGIDLCHSLGEIVRFSKALYCWLAFRTETIFYVVKTARILHVWIQQNMQSLIPKGLSYPGHKTIFKKVHCHWPHRDNLSRTGFNYWWIEKCSPSLSVANIDATGAFVELSRLQTWFQRDL